MLLIRILESSLDIYYSIYFDDTVCHVSSKFKNVMARKYYQESPSATGMNKQI